MGLAEVYLNRFTDPQHRPTRRYWVHPLILVGGNINDWPDFYHLEHDLEITSVLNVDGRSERELLGEGVELFEVPLVDDGNPFSILNVRKAIGWAINQLDEGVIYVHCHIGVSRSPAIAYGILRWRYQLTRSDALAMINAGGGEFGNTYESVPKHLVYLDAVDAALSCSLP